MADHGVIKNLNDSIARLNELTNSLGEDELSFLNLASSLLIAVQIYLSIPSDQLKDFDALRESLRNGVAELQSLVADRVDAAIADSTRTGQD